MQSRAMWENTSRRGWTVAGQVLEVGSGLGRQWPARNCWRTASVLADRGQRHSNLVQSGSCTGSNCAGQIARGLQWFRASSGRITLLFILLAVVVCALLNAGNLGTIDTARRWQVARSIRLGEPTVTSDDVRQGFGIPGRKGVPHAWYGVGQSLLLLPIDALVDATVSPLLRRFSLDPIRRKQVAELTVAFLMQAFLTACVLLFARSVLLTFGFGSTAAVAGSLALLFATTCLQYVQCAQENELLLALAFTALAGLRAWHREERGRWALLAGTAWGFAILVRLTALLETGVFAFFTIAVGTNPKRFLAWFAPPVVGGLLFDRWYQWHRFGELFSTYIGIFGRLNRPLGQPAPV